MLNFDRSIEHLTGMLRDASRLSAPRADDILALASQFIFGVGFQRMRYYRLAAETFNGADRERRLYLNWQRSVDGLPPAAPLGYTIRWSETTLSHHSEDTSGSEDVRPVVESDFGSEHHSVNEVWVKDLRLSNTSWVDVPVFDGRELIGMVAADWSGPPKELNNRDQLNLTLFGSILGAELAAATPPIAEDLEFELDLEKANRSRVASVLESVSSAAALFQKAMNIASVSVFEHSWSKNQLRRVYINFAKNFESEISTLSELLLDEQYEIGVGLTGRVWEAREGILILDYEGLVREYPELRCGNITDLHSLVDSPVQSVMYGLISPENPRYLLRFINNTDHPERPLLNEYDVLLKFLEDLSSDIDRALTATRAAAISSTLQLLSRKAGAQEFATEISKTLRDVEGIDSPIIFGQRKTSPRPHFFFGLDYEITNRIRNDLPSDPIYTAALDGGHSFSHRALTRGPMATAIRSVDPQALRVGIFPFASGNSRGVICIPLRGPKEAYGEAAFPSRDTDRFIAQLAATFGESLESEFVDGQTEGAMRALRLVGHEMGTPLAVLTNSVRSAINRARDAARSLPTSPENSIPVGYFDSLQAEIDRNAELLNAAIQMGVLVGRQSGRRIVGFRRRVGVRETITRSMKRVTRELDKGVLYSPESLSFARPDVNSSIQVVADPGLLESAIANIYRNAAKYSLKLASGLTQPITTTVTTASDYLRIQIGNHGMGIVTHQEDLMFEAFTRMATAHPDVSLRGMGLGLYLVRQIARSHQGDVLLAVHQVSESKRTPVYHTEFELRLSQQLPEGQYEYRIDSEDSL